MPTVDKGRELWFLGVFLAQYIGGLALIYWLGLRTGDLKLLDARRVGDGSDNNVHRPCGSNSGGNSHVSRKFPETEIRSRLARGPRGRLARGLAGGT